MAFPKPTKVSLLLNTSFLLLLSLHLTTHHHPPSTTHRLLLRHQISPDGCDRLHDFPDPESKCLYLQQDPSCLPKGYINYLHIFYCSYGPHPPAGLAVLLLWLAVLFYLLATTAAQYFCSTLDGLSTLLRLSPAVAGVTLLSLGNGAPDVFAGIVSFTRSGNADVGLNSILGGGFFVSSVVVGVIGFVVAPKRVSIDKPCFFRDVVFLIFALLSLLAIVFVGKISFFGAVGFVSIYVVYVCSVSAMQILNKMKKTEPEPESDYLTVSVTILDFSEQSIPLLGYSGEEKQKSSLSDKNMVRNRNQDQERGLSFFHCLWRILEMPLYLPRRLTIPLVCEAHWSKPYGVASAGLAPLLLAAQWAQNTGPAIAYIAAGLTGLVLAGTAHLTTKRSTPPKRFLFPWLAGGFVMSVTWTYITASELVSLLVGLGHILGIRASVLGLTVLAWGNSLGDLVANVAMAVNGGPDGAQVAVSGCYAGPVFNTLMGLGLSMVFASWSGDYVIPDDRSLYETVGFLVGGLLWAVVVLPRRGMRLDRLFGCGLVAIYLCFLFLRLARTIGILEIED